MTLLIARITDDNEVVIVADTKESLIKADGTTFISYENKRKIFSIHSNFYIATSGLDSENAISLIRNILSPHTQVTKELVVNCCMDVFNNQLELFKKYNSDDTRGTTKSIICGVDPEHNSPFIITFDQRGAQPQLAYCGFEAFAGSKEGEAKTLFRSKLPSGRFGTEREVVNAAVSTIFEMSAQSNFIGAGSHYITILKESTTEKYYDGSKFQNSNNFLDKNRESRVNKS